MRPFNAAFTNELARIFIGQKTIVFFIVNIVIILLYVLLYTNSFTASAAGYMVSLHRLFFMAVFPLYIFMETMDVFNGEVSDMTIRNVLIRPVTRLKIYLAKVCAVCVFILVQILFTTLFVTVFSIFIGESAASVVNAAAAFIITFIPMTAFVFTAAFVSQLVKNGMLGMLLCIVFLLISYTAEALAPAVSAFLFVRYIGLYKMLLTGDVYPYGVLTALIIIASYVVASLTAGALIFGKKEF